MERDAGSFAAAEQEDGACDPVLCWFTWDRPTVSLGRHESLAGFDVEALAAAGIPLCVRPTGGRAVFHVDEWTYAALVPLEHPTLGGSLATSTRALTQVVATALERAYGLRCDGPGDTGAEDRLSAGPPTCFARSFGYELTVSGRKLMGSAQRRGRRALLQQGSLLVGPGHERIARFLHNAAGDPRAAAGEAALRSATTNLAALLGRRPDPGPFREALAGAWHAALQGRPWTGGASGSGQASATPLDRPGHPS